MRVAVACLLIAASLVGVGVVSGTLLRHLVQIAPVLAAAALAGRKPRLGAAAALPIFVTWLAIPVLIWLFLLGITRMVQGTFTPAEVALTLVMAGASIAGGVAAARLLKGASIAVSVALALLFGALQLEAMKLSFRPAFSQDRK